MKRNVRVAAGMLILAVSLALLLWAYWPAARRIQVLPVDPSNLALPTPVSVLLQVRVAGA